MMIVPKTVCQGSIDKKVIYDIPQTTNSDENKVVVYCLLLVHRILCLLESYLCLQSCSRSTNTT